MEYYIIKKSSQWWVHVEHNNIANGFVFDQLSDYVQLVDHLVLILARPGVIVIVIVMHL